MILLRKIFERSDTRPLACLYGIDNKPRLIVMRDETDLHINTFKRFDELLEKLTYIDNNPKAEDLSDLLIEILEIASDY